MPKKPNTFNCHCATPNQVRFVTELTPGIAPTTFINHAIPKAIVLKRMNFPGVGLSVRAQSLQVLQMFDITDSAVTTVRMVATVLSEGIHAGTGADFGMPL